jgi:hypothetical protein
MRGANVEQIIVQPQKYAWLGVPYVK